MIKQHTKYGKEFLDLQTASIKRVNFDVLHSEAIIKVT